MEKYFGVLITILSIGQLIGQTPEKFSYQAVFRDSTNELLQNDTISIRLSILSDSIGGNVEFAEVHTAITNDNGMVSLEIGAGTAAINTFGAIDWSDGPFFVQVESDFRGGNNFTMMGSSQLLSVPYALFAKRANYADNVEISLSDSGDTLFIGANNFLIIPGINAANTPINVPFVPVECNGSTVVVEVTTATGRVWMDRNMSVAGNPGDPGYTNSLGGHYQWGRFSDGHQCFNSETITDTLATTWVPNMGNPWDGKYIKNTTGAYNSEWLYPSYSSLWNGVDGDNNPCPTGFRLPTSAEWLSERATWTSFNAAGALNSPLELLMAGKRLPGSGGYVNIGTGGYYWTSEPDGLNSKSFSFNASVAVISADPRGVGLPVRCIKD